MTQLWKMGRCLWVGDADDWGLGWAMGMSGIGMWVSWEMEWGTFRYEVRHRSVALNVGVGGGKVLPPE